MSRIVGSPSPCIRAFAAAFAVFLVGCSERRVDPLLLAEPARSYLDSLRLTLEAQYRGPNPRLAMQENGCLGGRMNQVLDRASSDAVSAQVARDEQRYSRAERRRLDSTLTGLLITIKGPECDTTDSAWRAEQFKRRIP
jgi:hypothetical protein